MVKAHALTSEVEGAIEHQQLHYTEEQELYCVADVPGAEQPRRARVKRGNVRQLRVGCVDICQCLKICSELSAGAERVCKRLRESGAAAEEHEGGEPAVPGRNVTK